MFNENSPVIEIQHCKMGYFSIWQYRESSDSIAFLINYVSAFQHMNESFNSFLENV